MKVPELEQLITHYVQQQTRTGKWVSDPNVFNQCLECRRSLNEHELMTILCGTDKDMRELALVCPDYIDKYTSSDPHEKLLNDTVTFL